MIRINIAPVLDKIKGIYGEKRYRVDDPDYGKAGPPKKTDRKKIDVSLAERLKLEITSCLDKIDPNGTQEILEAFLREHFVNDRNEVDEGKIETYLFCENPEDYIKSFWGIVSEKWCARLGNLPNPPEYYAHKLCQLNSNQKFDQPEDKRPKHKEQDEIPHYQELAPFFRVYPVQNDPKYWKVIFHFHDELYAPVTGTLKILKGIFSYEEKMTKKFRHELVSAMEVTVCPYCNRQYITNYTSKGEEKPLSDLDHYYCKSRYPFLALSLYNFVPGCQICNQRFKGHADFYITPHVNPHKGEFGSDGRFELEDENLLMDLSAWNQPERFVVTLKGQGPNADAINHSIETFHLKEVYKSHYDYAWEIRWKSIIYSKELIETVKSEFDDLFQDENEIIDFIFGQYVKQGDESQRPLAKLAKDLLKDWEPPL